MEGIVLDLSRYTKSVGPHSERGELIEKFTDRLNLDRIGTKYKILNCARVRVKLAHLSVPDLYAFWKKCSDSTCFSKVFWGALKI